MHNLKNYKKIMKVIEKNKSLEVKNNGRKNSVKILHIDSNEFRTVHPGEKAIEPIKKWLRKFNILL